MLLSDIYNTGAALISEQPDGADNADLQSRAAYLLFQIISELVPLDRAATGGECDYPTSPCSLDDEFPLCDGLAHVCAYKLAYLLVSDENTVLGAALKAEYENAKRNFINSLPADVMRITEVYP